MSTFIKGEQIILDVWDGSAYKPVACLTNNSLSRTRNIIEAQTKCEPGIIEKQGGSESHEIAIEGLYINTTDAVGGDDTKISHDALMPIFDTGAIDTWRMSTALTDTPYYYGTGVFSDLVLDTPAGDEFASFTATISGIGAPVTVDPNA